MTYLFVFLFAIRCGKHFASFTWRQTTSLTCIISDSRSRFFSEDDQLDVSIFSMDASYRTDSLIEQLQRRPLSNASAIPSSITTTTTTWKMFSHETDDRSSCRVHLPFRGRCEIKSLFCFMKFRNKNRCFVHLYFQNRLLGEICLIVCSRLNVRWDLNGVGVILMRDQQRVPLELRRRTQPEGQMDKEGMRRSSDLNMETVPLKWNITEDFELRKVSSGNTTFGICSFESLWSDILSWRSIHACCFLWY